MIHIPSLSIVIPAHNEDATVENVVEEVYAVVRKMKVEYEIILVNDGSTDSTGEIGRTLTSKIPNFRLVEHFPSLHYGGTLKAGFTAATKEIIVLFPADKQFVFTEIDILLAKLSSADLVSGCRADRQDNLIRRMNAFGWNMVVRALFGYLCRDINCGFKLFRREILNHVKLMSDGALVDTELLAGAKSRGYRISEVEVTHLPRTSGRATGANKKVILRAFGDLLRFTLRLNRELRRGKRTR